MGKYCKSMTGLQSFAIGDRSRYEQKLYHSPLMRIAQTSSNYVEWQTRYRYRYRY